MAQRGAILTARSFVEVFADLDKLRVGLKAGERMVANFANKIGDIGKQLMKTSAVLAAPQALAIKTFGSFEKSMSRVKALTQATEQQFQSLSRRAQDLGRDTVFTAGEAADAMAVFAQAGFKVNEILKATGPALDLAAAGQIGIAEAADISSKIMAGMGLTAEELSGSIDVLAKAMSSSNTDISMLGDAFKFVGPVAKSAGIAFEEITAAIQLLSNAGVQGEMAGTTLRGMIMTLGSPTEKAREKLAELGIEVKDSAGRIRSLADIIGQFEKALSGMENGDRLDILGQIFPDRQAAGGIELIAQGSQKLREFTAALQDAGGTAERIAKTQLDNLWGRLQLITSAAEAVAITFTSHIQPSISRLMDGLSTLITAFDTWLQKNPEASQQLALLTAGLFATGAALVAAKVAMMAFAKSLGVLALFSNKWVAVGALALVASGQVHRAVDAINRAVEDLRGVWSTAWAEMTRAVEEGDLGRAVKIAFLTMKVTVLRVMQELRKEFVTAFAILDKVVEKLTDAAHAIHGLIILGDQMAHGEQIQQVRVKKDPKTGKFVVSRSEQHAPGEQLRMKRDPKTGRWVTSRIRQDNSTSDAVVNAETELRKLLEEKKPNLGPRSHVAAMLEAQNFGMGLNPVESPAIGPALRPGLFEPNRAVAAATPVTPPIIPADAAAKMQASAKASSSLTPLGQFEKGSDGAMQLVLDALGMGGSDTLANIYEEMKSVATNTQEQLSLARREANKPKDSTLAVAVAKRNA